MAGYLDAPPPRPAAAARVTSRCSGPADACRCRGPPAAAPQTDVVGGPADGGATDRAAARLREGVMVGCGAGSGGQHSTAFPPSCSVSFPGDSVGGLRNDANGQRSSRVGRLRFRYEGRDRGPSSRFRIESAFGARMVGCAGGLGLFVAA